MCDSQSGRLNFLAMRSEFAYTHCSDPLKIDLMSLKRKLNRGHEKFMSNVLASFDRVVGCDSLAGCEISA